MQRQSKRRAHRSALLLVDFLNPLDFSNSRPFFRRAEVAARNTLELRKRMQRAKVPVIYANDHWGDWTHSVDELMAAIVERDAPGRRLVEILAPEPGDYTILKPRHSAFYGTPLTFLLQELQIESLIVTGIAADNCVLFTASDAYVRQYQLWIPSNCVASEKDADRRSALLHMQRVLKAQIHAA